MIFGFKRSRLVLLTLQSIKREKKNEESYFFYSTDGFSISRIFELRHYASNMAG